MVIDNHEHVMLPTSLQIQKMDEAQIDKTILFTTTPHLERAKTAALKDIDKEMAVLYRVLGGTYTPEERRAQMKACIVELTSAIASAPDRFFGFGPVPLGLSLPDTSTWIEQHVVRNALKGVGEFTPGSDAQMEELTPIFAALSSFPGLPVWVHTFHPVGIGGLKILMRLCEEYPSVPVIFGHMGGIHWMEAIAFAKNHNNVYLDLSAAFTTLSVKCALTEVPERCLFGSDAPFGAPVLCRQLIEYVSPSAAATEMALGNNIARLLQL
ncbi:amidohydrolase family protein [Selenomonas artemidis]|uniref:amidohydrolase family protein n=1 Tax=Selenomonas artemidis TaxID=671224 RepID=UPI00288BA6B7|nr:amidohydrolase family protein [Selenomonas artemidis]